MSIDAGVEWRSIVAMHRRLPASLLLPLLALACTPPGDNKRPPAEPVKTSPPADPHAGKTEPGPKPRVVVIGGGLAGLVAAYELQRHGITSHVLEASDLLGGRVQTAYYGEGLSAEFGMQEMWQGNPLLDIAKELGVTLDGEPEPAYSSLVLEDKLRPFVQDTTKEYFASFLNAKEQKALREWMEKARKLHEEAEKHGLASPELVELQGMSFTAWMTKLKLPSKVAAWIETTLECELATTADQFSALYGLMEFGIFLDEDTPNYHVKGGNTKLIQAIAEAIRGPKTTGALVTNVRRRVGAGGKVEGVDVSYIRNNVMSTISAERVVVAVPFYRLHQISFEPPISADRWMGIQTLGLGQYTVVHFLISKDARKLWTIDGESALPVLTDGPLGVIYGVQKESPAEQPLDVFALLIYGMRARMFHMVPREAKVKELLGELDKLWPGFSGFVKDSYVYTYHPASLAVFPPGRSPIDPAAQLIRTPELGTYLAGDWTLGGHSDHAAKSGLAAARGIAAELGAGVK